MPDHAAKPATPAETQKDCCEQGASPGDDPCRFPLEFEPPVVRFNRLSSGVRLLEATLDADVQAWCADHIGRFVLEADVLHVDNAGNRLHCTIRFESERDRLAFRLRWA